MKKIIVILLLSCLACLSAKSGKLVYGVRGVVVDTSYQPIEGASVVITGTTTGLITDSDGTFMFPPNVSASSLDVSCIGYKFKRVTLVTMVR